MPISQSPSLQEIVSFFGGPANLAAYVRGGPYVPNIPANSSISTTVAGLSMAQFRGADKSSGLGIGQGQVNFSTQTSGTRSNSGNMGIRIQMYPSGGNGTYTYSMNVVSFSQSITGWVTPFMSGNDNGSIYVFTAFNGSVAPDSTVEATAVIDVTVSSAGLTATKRFNLTFSYTRTAGGGGIIL